MCVGHLQKAGVALSLDCYCGVVVADHVPVGTGLRELVAVADDGPGGAVDGVRRFDVVTEATQQRVVIPADEHGTGVRVAAGVDERVDGPTRPIGHGVEPVEHVAGEHDGPWLRHREEVPDPVYQVGPFAERKRNARGFAATDVEVGYHERGRLGEEHTASVKRCSVHDQRCSPDSKTLALRRAEGFLFWLPRSGDMTGALEDKRTATRFRILVEIADRQPAVSQGEIADAVGVTSQAVSEYIRDLVADGYVDKEARSRYRVTKEGVDWLFQEAKGLRRFAEHVTEDVLESVQEDAAIATAPIEAGETVTLSLRDGLLHAAPDDAGPATGVATTSAGAGDDVSVTGFEGVIEIDPGRVTVIQVPSARAGGSRAVPAEGLRTVCADASVVVAAGVEAVLSLRDAGVEIETTFAAGAVAAEAAARGVDAVVVATADAVGRVTDALRDGDVLYEVTEAGAAVGVEFGEETGDGGGADAGNETSGDGA